jgi:hypothetical protein
MGPAPRAMPPIPSAGMLWSQGHDVRRPRLLLDRESIGPKSKMGCIRSTQAQHPCASPPPRGERHRATRACPAMPAQSPTVPPYLAGDESASPSFSAISSCTNPSYPPYPLTLTWQTKIYGTEDCLLPALMAGLETLEIFTLPPTCQRAHEDTCRRACRDTPPDLTFASQRSVTSGPVFVSTPCVIFITLAISM